MASAELAEAWQLDWIEKVIDKLELPEKFFICGHSYGGWLSSLYASQHPERIEALFLNSPGGMMPYDPETYDPYKFLDYNDLHRIAPKSFVDKELRRAERKGHPIGDAHGVPQFLVRWDMGRRMTDTMCNMNPGKCSEQEITLMTEYSVVMMENYCDIETM